MTLYFSFDYISGSLATIISFTFPAMVLAVEMVRGREAIRAKKIIAVALSLAGLICIVWAPSIEVKIIGVIFAVGCAFAAILLFCLGVKLIGTSNASLINTFEPVFACVFGYLLMGDLITVGMVIGGALVVMAVLLANIPDRNKTA